MLGEVAFYVYDADGEEAGFVVERFEGPVVDVDCSVRRQAVQDPEVPVPDWVRDREEARVEGDF